MAKQKQAVPKLLHPKCPSCQCVRTSKYCPSCKLDVPIDQWKVKSNGQITAYCSSCEREVMKVAAKRTKEKLQAQRAELQALRERVKQLEGNNG